MSRNHLTTIVLLLCIFQPIDTGFAEDSGLLIFMPAIIHKPHVDNIPIGFCPQTQSLFTIVPNHSWTFETKDKSINVTGHLPLQNGCKLWILGDLVWGENCIRKYTNTGKVHAGEECTIKGESTAKLSFDGFCQNGVVELTITDIQNPDAGLGGELICPTLGTFPHVTYYPPTKDRHIITLTAGWQNLIDEDSSDNGYSWIKNYHFINERME